MGRRFENSDADAYAHMGQRIVMLSDVRPRVEPGMPQKEKKDTVHEDFKDMEEQRVWVERMRPRRAFLRFRLPYEGKTKVEYLDGEMHLQPFTKRSSTEVGHAPRAPPPPFLLSSIPHRLGQVRLSVASPDPETGAYPTRIYDCKVHEECMFHHNCTTRRAHIGPRKVDENGRPVGKRVISYDHSLAHAILHAWVQRARHDPDLVHGLQGEALDRHIYNVLMGLDVMYGKMLGMRWSDQFEHIVGGDPPPPL